jgi:LPS export ABC transporter protein LptC
VIKLNVKRIILAVVVLALTVPSVFFIESHEGTENASITRSFMEDIRVVNKGTGRDNWTLDAQKVEIPPDGKASRLSLVTITLPEHQMDVKSEAGIYDLESRDLTLTGNIEAKTDNYVLMTDSIHLKSKTGELTSPDRVVLEGSSFRIEGDGFHTNGSKKVTFNRNVKATFF